MKLFRFATTAYITERGTDVTARLPNVVTVHAPSASYADNMRRRIVEKIFPAKRYDIEITVEHVMLPPTKSEPVRYAMVDAAGPFFEWVGDNATYQEQL